MLETGIRSELEKTVKEDMSAKYVGSGGLNVLATPILVSFVENCAYESIKNYLDDNFTTVGTKIEINHIAPTPIGMKIKIITELIEIDRKKLIFKFVIYDDKEEISNGIHERFIVDKYNFQNKANSKLD